MFNRDDLTLITLALNSYANDCALIASNPSNTRAWRELNVKLCEHAGDLIAKIKNDAVTII